VESDTLTAVALMEVLKDGYKILATKSDTAQGV